KKKFIASAQNIPTSHTEILTNNRYQNVRTKFSLLILQFEVLPEYCGEVSIPVLVIIHDAAVKILPASFYHCSQTNNLGSGPAADHHLRFAVIFPLKIVFNTHLSILFSA